VTVFCEEERLPAAASTATTTPPPIRAETSGMREARFIAVRMADGDQSELKNAI
jgi:hypothetical protein